jgi:hypothetical protein
MANIDFRAGRPNIEIIEFLNPDGTVKQVDIIWTMTWRERFTVLWQGFVSITQNITYNGG